LLPNVGASLVTRTANWPRLGVAGDAEVTVKTSISLADEQDAYARSLVASERYASVSAVQQRGLEMLRQDAEIHDAQDAEIHDAADRGASRADRAVAGGTLEAARRR
jgi:Arc/MetJ-type ribon-helix-helix transcriptional regulator